MDTLSNLSHIRFAVCRSLQCGEQVGRFWAELDSTRTGGISLVDLDADSVILLARFRERLLSLLPCDSQDKDCLFARLTYQLPLRRPGHLEAHEFRTAVVACLSMALPEGVQALHKRRRSLDAFAV